MSPFDIHTPGRRVDIDFSVPFRHRLRFTEDCFGADWSEVLGLLETTEALARVQVWLDGGLKTADPSLPGRIEAAFRGSPTIELTGPIGVLEGGEQIKNSSATVDHLLSAIHRDRLDRRNYIFVIGGGAVLDAVGYAAAIAHRGIRLVRFPTTTLAQADSGVGVKNAVNYFGKKNWVGTFAVPWAVVNDRGLLHLLSDRDFRSGYSEAVKVALLKDPTTFDWLCQEAKAIADRQWEVACQAIRSSVLIHLQHITHGGDPFEANEARPLDFGHWSAHKLESLCQYRLRHGEAVAIGVALDVVYSSLVHGLPKRVVDKTLQLFHDLRLPVFHPLLKEKILFEGLEEFRQHLGGRLTLTMLRDLGQMIQVHDVDRARMGQAISYLSQQPAIAGGG
jgi:3-dehydroquinate synthase